MLDPAVTLALCQFPALPPRIETAEERLWLSDHALKAERWLHTIGESQEAAVRDWMKRHQQALLHLDSIGLDQSWTQAQLDNLSDLIEFIEREAEIRSKSLIRNEKKFSKGVKQISASDAGLGVIYKAHQKRLALLDRQIIECMLDTALHLRALRSEHESDRGTGQTFADPAELEAYLKTAL